jgi:hypothetical protein
MVPWGHLAVGYLAYSLAVRACSRTPPSGPAVLALAVGTQTPDLLDTPLTVWVAVLPAGRSLGHSLLFGLAVGGVLWLLARHTDRRGAAIGFVAGHLTHVITDAVPAALAGRWRELGFVLWPVTPAYLYDADDRVLVDYLLTQLTNPPHTQLVVLALAASLWVIDDTPGSRTVRTWLRTHTTDREAR